MIAIAILVLSLGAAGKLYLNERDDRIKAETSLETTKLTLKATVANFKAQALLSNQLNIAISKITMEKDIAISKLNSYRSRENVIKKNPKLIERLANSATKRMFNDLCSSSGGDCKDKAAKAKPDNPTTD